MFFWLCKENKTKKYGARKTWLISLSNLNYSLQRSIILITIYSIAIVVLNAIMISFQDQPREMITTVISFFVVIFLLLTSMVYKYSLEANTRKKTYLNLYKLGYTVSKLKQIIKQEVCWYYLMLNLFPLIYILSALVVGYIYHAISLSLLIAIISFIVLSSLIAGMITYIVYKKSVINYLKGSI